MASACAACHYAKRSCPSGCIFYPYFPSDDPERFAFVKRIFGTSNASKTLKQVPEDKRAQAAECMYLEAKCRVQDPVNGCVGLISRLHQEVNTIENEMTRIKVQIEMSRSQAQERSAQQSQSENRSSWGDNNLNSQTQELDTQDSQSENSSPKEDNNLDFQTQESNVQQTQSKNNSPLGHNNLDPTCKITDGLFLESTVN